MSSPPDSLNDFEDSASNKKRGRAHSVEPTAIEVEHENNETEEILPDVSASKKTKRDEEDNNSASVSTIRRNMKEMTTKDKSPSDSQEEDENMGTKEDEQITEEKKIAEEKTAKPLTQFGAKSDEDDWGEFAEEEEEISTKDNKNNKDISEKPKYTFGASSGFGTKGWAAVHQTVPTSSKVNQPAFGGFSSFGFGGIKATTDKKTEDAPKAKEERPNTSAPASTPSFASFAKATVSPFAAAAAAASSGNKIVNTLTPSESTMNNETEKEVKSDDEEEEAHNFGKEAKVKVPGIKPTDVKTGEEDEDTIYQTKAKLLILDGSSGNWKERGVGTFRINVKEEENKSTPQTRLVMRADSVYRLILNLLLFQGMKVFIMQEKFVRFAGFEKDTKEDGTSETKLVNFALKLSNSAVAKEVCETINAHIPPTSSDKA
ncbi:hypothetical protein G6F37_003710 [Rhizopus arrhizus]|nr:hypothetical protein G6F38_003899 [Rhizopus arrhizus]KAG1160739.1 hypothetical protein G6F37_003710 [Rhizopus arrhizus]